MSVRLRSRYVLRLEPKLGCKHSCKLGADNMSNQYWQSIVMQQHANGANRWAFEIGHTRKRDPRKRPESNREFGEVLWNRRHRALPCSLNSPK
jgi:hypothetical protein